MSDCGTFEADFDVAVQQGQATIEPGCNMPSLPFFPEHPDLWWYAVEGTKTGLVSALADEDRRRSDDQFGHLVFFPTWSGRSFAFFTVQPGQKVRVQAIDNDTLQVICQAPADPDATWIAEATFPNQMLVLVHSSLDLSAVQAFYSQEI